MMIYHILSFPKRYKKILFFIAVFFGFFIFFGDISFAAVDAGGAGGGAATPAGGTATDPVVSKEVSEKVVTVLNGIITGASAIMGLLTSFITIFLYPGWVNGTLFGLQDYLKEIWILISNVVYFVFAFILIAIAFMNIIGKGEGTWELKQAMPKFIVGVLIVPFSWFFVQFMLSLSAILTVGVLTLPYDSFSSETLFQKGIEALEDEEICKDVIINFSDEKIDGATEFAAGAGGDDAVSERILCAEDGTVSVKELFEGTGDGAGLQNSVFGIINLYTYGILKIQELDTITGTDLESITKIADLIFKILFDLLFIIVYVLLMVALFLALFVRGVRLWIYVMLSPTFGLLYFFGKVSEGVGDSDNKFSIKEFVALAMVPVYVAAALAFGLVFILVASEGIKETTTQGDEDTLKAGGFSLTIKGAHGDGESEKSVIGKLIVEIFGVVILWIAVMAALKSSATTKTVVEPIAAFGKSVGDLAAKAPTYAPIIPTGSGGFQSAQSLQKIGSSLQGNMSAEATSRASRFLKTDEVTASINEVRERAVSDLRSNSADVKLNAQRFEEFLKSAKGDASKLFNSPENRRYLKELQEKFLPEGERRNVDTRAGFAEATDRLIARFNGTHQINLGGGALSATVGDMSNWSDFERVIRETATMTPSSGTPGAGNTTNDITVNMNATNGETVFTKNGDSITFKPADIQYNGTGVNMEARNVDFLRSFLEGLDDSKAINELQRGGFDEDQAKAILRALGRSVT